MDRIEIIKQYARSLARRWGHYDSDDIVAEALLAYVKATKKLEQEIEIQNQDAYIQSWITGACKSAMFRKRHKTEPLTEDIASYVMDYTKEFVEALKLTDVENQILNYRLQGYVDKEIGTELGMSQAGVHKARRRIMRKFDKLIRE